MGRPKAWLAFHGEPLLFRVARIMSESLSPMVVVAAEGQPLPDLPLGVRVLRDTQAGRGPLEGIAVGLEATGVASFVSACDAPFLTTAFVRRMIEELGDADLVIPETAGRRHTLSGVYRPSVVSLIRQLLDSGETRPAQLFARCRPRFVKVENEPSLQNINTPEEYEAAIRSLPE